MTEQAIRFGAAQSLVGIVSEPESKDTGRPAFIFLNAGVTHRVGPNRIYVRVARDLVGDGFTSLRYDFSGLGDSVARTDDMTAWKSVVAETREAMDFLGETRGIEQFVLIGICSGAASSFATAKADPRVVGAVLINGQAHLHGEDLALTDHLRELTLGHHSWRIALKSSFRAKNFKKLFGGQLSPARIFEMLVVSPVRGLFERKSSKQEVVVPDVLPDLRALTQRGVRLFHLYCEGDEGLDYFHVLLGDGVRAAATDENSRFEVIPGSNHMFTLHWTQDRLSELVRDWAAVYTDDAARPEGTTR